MSALYLFVPHLRHGAFAVWRRNALVWRKLMIPSLLINFGEPFLYLLGLGYGLGLYIGEMMQMPYLTFLASGILASSTMNTASFESMYSAYTRMVPQRTYEAILSTPLEVQDILLGEALWSATKCAISGSGILLVAAVLGAVHDWQALWVIPVIFLTGFCFSCLGLLVCTFARGYDYFNYYMTLVLTPIFLLSGVFYPVSSLPTTLQSVVQFFPLVHAVELVRPLVAGRPLLHVGFHLGVLLVYGVAAFGLAVKLARQRLVV
ncbi:MAG: ABC transporter permease [Gammaproteobacteria bacterium]|nr:ABC transporter permease [Gammaproteobacteria bacterium]